MKTVNKMQTALKVLAVAMVLAISACNPYGDDEPGGGGGGKPQPKPPVVKDCNLTGTMVRVMCGPSIYDDLWIKMDNGKLIQPCDQSFQTFRALDFEEGDKVTFSYRESKGTSPCSDRITCQVALPEHTVAIIDCINEVAKDPQTGDCGTLIQKKTPEGGTVNVLDATVTGNTLKLKVGQSGCSMMSKEEFMLTWDGTMMKSLPAQVELHINTKRTEMCQAYFTHELCFDISALKRANNQQIRLTIQGVEIFY